MTARLLRSDHVPHAFINPSKPNSLNCYTLLYKPNLPFFHFWHSGPLALSPERQRARMSEMKNGRLGLYGAEYSKCNHTMTVGFKGLTSTLSSVRPSALNPPNPLSRRPTFGSWVLWSPTLTEARQIGRAAAHPGAVLKRRRNDLSH